MTPFEFRLSSTVNHKYAERGKRRSPKISIGRYTIIIHINMIMTGHYTVAKHGYGSISTSLCPYIFYRGPALSPAFIPFPCLFLSPLHSGPVSRNRPLKLLLKEPEADTSKGKAKTKQGPFFLLSSYSQPNQTPYMHSSHDETTFSPSESNAKCRFLLTS